MFILLVRLQVRPELVKEFEAAALKNARLSLERDPGCRKFEVSREQEDPTRWVFYETYDKEADWVAHRSSAHFLEFKELGDRAIVTREAIKLTPVPL